MDRPVTERDSQVCLADTRGSDHQNVGFLLDEPQRGEVFDEPAVEGGLCGEVELLECFVGGELRESHPPVEAALLACRDFSGEEVVQELRVAGLLALGVLEGRCERVCCGAELQVREMAAELLVDRVGAHQHATSASLA